ncbi:MAG: hypothetical protein IJD13_10155 [Oscillospiraceae bacterium]|nr:hypothetical protein [Oscillospiraceae bacterium]
MAAVNPLQVMLQPVLRQLNPWIVPVSEVIIALALLYCLLLMARVARYPKNEEDAAESRQKAQRNLLNGIISSVLLVIIILLIRWGLSALSVWIGI